MKKIISITLILTLCHCENIFAMGIMLAPASFSETGFDEEDSPLDMDGEYFKFKPILDNLEDERHKVTETRNREEKKARYIELYRRYHSEIIKFDPPRSVKIGALNARGYCANEIARRALFDLEILKVSERDYEERAEKLSREIDYWLQNASSPNFRLVLDKNRNVEGFKIGYSRACSGYSFGRMIRAERDIKLSKLFPQKKREHLRSALDNINTSLRYSIKGLKSNHNNDHAREALEQSLCLLLVTLEPYSRMPIETLKQASYRQTFLSLGMLHLLKSIEEIPNLGGLERGYLDKVITEVEKTANKAKKITDAERNLPELFVRAALPKEDKSEEFSNIDDFKALLHYYAELEYPDCYELLKPTINNWKYDFMDVAIVRVIAAKRGTDIWNATTFLRSVSRIDKNVTREKLVDRIESRRYAWLGLEPEILPEEAEVDSSKLKKTLRLRTAVQQNSRYKTKQAKNKELIGKLDLWIGAPEMKNLKRMAGIADSKLEAFSKMVEKLKKQDSATTQDLERLYEELEGIQRIRGCKGEVDYLLQKIGIHIKSVIDGDIEKLAEEAESFRRKSEFILNANKFQETESIFAHCVDTKQRAKELANENGKHFLSCNLYLELLEELKNIEQNLSALEPRVRAWKILHDNITSIKDSVKDIEIMDKKIEGINRRADRLIILLDAGLLDPERKVYNNDAFRQKLESLKAEAKTCIETQNKFKIESDKAENSLDNVLYLIRIAIRYAFDTEEFDTFKEMETELNKLKAEFDELSGNKWDEAKWNNLFGRIKETVDKCINAARKFKNSTIIVAPGAREETGLSGIEELEYEHIDGGVRTLLRKHIEIKEFSDQIFETMERNNVRFVRVAVKDPEEFDIEARNFHVVHLKVDEDNNPIGIESAKIFLFYGYDLELCYSEIAYFLSNIMRMDIIFSNRELSAGVKNKLFNTDYIPFIANLWLYLRFDLFGIDNVEDAVFADTTIAAVREFLDDKVKLKNITSLLDGQDKEFTKAIETAKALLRNKIIKTTVKICEKGRSDKKRMIAKSSSVYRQFISCLAVNIASEEQRIDLLDEYFTIELIEDEFRKAIAKGNLAIPRSKINEICANIFNIPTCMITTFTVMVAIAQKNDPSVPLSELAIKDLAGSIRSRLMEESGLTDTLRIMTEVETQRNGKPDYLRYFKDGLKSL